MSHCRGNTLQHEFCFWQMVWSASLMVAAVAMVEMVKAHVAKTFPDSVPLWNTSKPCSDCQGDFSHLYIELHWKNFMLSPIELDRTINVNFEDRKLLNKRENIIKEWCPLSFATLCILKPFCRRMNQIVAPVWPLPGVKGILHRHFFSTSTSSILTSSWIFWNISPTFGRTRNMRSCLLNCGAGILYCILIHNV